MYFRISFFNEFEPINPKVPLKKQSEDIRSGSAFEPKNVYDVLPVMKTSLSEKVSVILFEFKFKFGNNEYSGAMHQKKSARGTPWEAILKHLAKFLGKR